ncbi:MAG TPA: CAP domain-containing protein [Candidatus Angelobacter sp.]|nr:CAP domain-containing protein [Candidatus Angelobacter sp.]
MLELVNAARAEAGLSSLRWDSSLANAAREHTQLMIEHGELSHQFAGEPPLPQRAGAAGAHFNSVAENVAYAGSVPELHKDLMHSPHHRANILDPKSNAIGIGFAERDGELYVTEDFAHLIPSYTSQQFSAELVAAFNRLRRSKGLPPMAAQADQRLHDAACTARLDPKSVLRHLPGATTLAIFTAAAPDDLPATMQDAAGNRGLHRMDIGVCFKPDEKGGFSTYWVAAAFYPAAKAARR